MNALEYSSLALPGEVLDVLEGRRRWALVHGETLQLLLLMPDACVDAVITDPPYSSGGAFRGDRVKGTASKYVISRPSSLTVRAEFSGDNRDQRAFAHWCALWLYQALRVSKPGAPIVQCTDWRQLPATIDAIQAGGWVWRGIVPWDKTEGCRPQKGRFAAQCEFWPWGSNGPMPEERGVGCLPGIVRQFPKPTEKNHIASKTPSTMRPLVRICAPGGVILDPFAGGCSTGQAALEEGFRFIGFELDEANLIEGRKAMEAAERGLSLAQARRDPSQLSLVGDPK